MYAIYDGRFYLASEGKKVVFSFRLPNDISIKEVDGIWQDYEIVFTEQTAAKESIPLRLKLEDYYFWGIYNEYISSIPSRLERTMKRANYDLVLGYPQKLEDDDFYHLDTAAGKCVIAVAPYRRKTTLKTLFCPNYLIWIANPAGTYAVELRVHWKRRKVTKQKAVEELLAHPVIKQILDSIGWDDLPEQVEFKEY